MKGDFLTNKEELMNKIKDTIHKFEKEACLQSCKDALKEKVEPVEIIQLALTPAIQEVGSQFEKGDLSLVELMVAAETMQESLDYLLDSIPKDEYKPKATMVIGTVAGDIHDLGVVIVNSSVFFSLFSFSGEFNCILSSLIPLLIITSFFSKLLVLMSIKSEL